MHNGAALAALLVIAATSMPALAHDERAAPFTMAVILGEAHGSKVEAGQYEQAIERITESGRRLCQDKGHSKSRYGLRRCGRQGEKTGEPGIPNQEQPE